MLPYHYSYSFGSSSLNKGFKITSSSVGKTIAVHMYPSHRHSMLSSFFPLALSYHARVHYRSLSNLPNLNDCQSLITKTYEFHYKSHRMSSCSFVHSLSAFINMSHQAGTRSVWLLSKFFQFTIQDNLYVTFVCS